jgi:hypothetical protein
VREESAEQRAVDRRALQLSLSAPSRSPSTLALPVRTWALVFGLYVGQVVLIEHHLQWKRGREWQQAAAAAMPNISPATALRLPPAPRAFLRHP